MPRKKLGEVLRELGKISQQSLAQAIDEQSGKAVLLGELLLKRGLVSKADLVPALEEVTRAQYLDASSVTVSHPILRLVPVEVAKRHCALPLDRGGGKLVVVMAEPQDLYALKELAFVSGLDIAPRLGFQSEIRAAIQKYYEGSDQAPTVTEEEESSTASMEFFTTSSTQRNLDAIREFHAEMRKQPTPAVRLFSSIIAAAAAKKASDIHIDPRARGLIVRIRVDGILRDLMDVPQLLQDSLISRIKILADMDIAERRAPQDGRLLVAMGSEKRDLRVSTLPTQYGEKVVIRMLDSRAALVGFQQLGLWEEDADMLVRILTLPQGMLLVTGPTGSGKTTTLYAALNFLRSRTLNIITVEDPVEYRVEGVNQVQVNDKAGRTFAASLRSILRQDPNVIMVGEIRDSETAQTALTAAQTGHLLLSTMHTRDSITAIERLIDLNVPPYLVASSVTAVIAQRLVRRLCGCRDEAAASPEYADATKAAGIAEFKGKMYVPVGCPACDDTGYIGRLGIYEMLVFDEGVSEMVRSGAAPVGIRRGAQANGMRSLQQDALLKVNLGLTSLEEVMRVISLKDAGTRGHFNVRHRLA
ncbi:MAG: GspE/PulE family protein [Candidatus Acidiferrales bacterium]